ncbi:MAG: hypothetical protein WA799_00175 [Nitrosotalea sp.]
MALDANMKKSNVMSFSKMTMIFAAILLASVFVLYNAHAQTLSFSENSSTVVQPNSTISFGGFSNSTQIPTSQTQLTIKTDKLVYHHGDTITLTVKDINMGQVSDISVFKNKYAGIVTPCGIEYANFVFFPGIYNNIRSYDDLVNLQRNELNVVFSSPYKFVTCPMGYVKQINHVHMGNNDINATIDALTDSNQTVKLKTRLIGVYEINSQYEKEDLSKHVFSNVTQIYRNGTVLSVGNYTIVGFDLSGQITKPLVIQIENTSLDQVANNTVTSSFFLDKDGTNIVSILPATLLTTLLLIIITPFYYKKSNKKTSITALVLVIVMMSQCISPMQALATYDVSTQGIESQSTTSSFNQATVEGDFQGFKTDLDTSSYSNGFSVQNNHFVSNFVIGNDFLWMQSLVQVELPQGISFNSHSCTTQIGTYTCLLPSGAYVGAVYNYWTDPDFFGQCPNAGWTLDMTTGACYVAPTSSNFTLVSLTSSNTRIDFNAYQEIQSTGKIYLDAKYRTCTGSFSCTGYSMIYSNTTNTAYAQSPPNSYYTSYTPLFQSTQYSAGDVVGECGACDFGSGMVTFYEGMYGQLSYVINSSGSPAYGTNNLDTGETNNNILWWDSITNSGGSNPTFSTTLIHGCLPPASGDWIVTNSCTLRNSSTSPQNIVVTQDSVLAIPNGVTLIVHFNSNKMVINYGSGVLIQQGGNVKTG